MTTGYLFFLKYDAWDKQKEIERAFQNIPSLVLSRCFRTPELGIMEF